MEKLVIQLDKVQLEIDIAQLTNKLLSVFKATISGSPQEQVPEEKMRAARSLIRHTLGLMGAFSKQASTLQESGYYLNQIAVAVANSARDAANALPDDHGDDADRYLSDEEANDIVALVVYVFTKILWSCTSDSGLNESTLSEFSKVPIAFIRKREEDLANDIEEYQGRIESTAISALVELEDFTSSYKVVPTDRYLSNHPLRLHRSASYRDVFVKLLVKNNVVLNDEAALKRIFLATVEPIHTPTEKLRFDSEQSWFKMAAIFDHFGYEGKSTTGDLHSALESNPVRTQWIRENVLVNDQPLLLPTQTESRTLYRKRERFKKDPSMYGFAELWNAFLTNWDKGLEPKN
jgi:hypothetical protein